LGRRAQAAFARHAATGGSMPDMSTFLRAAAMSWPARMSIRNSGVVQRALDRRRAVSGVTPVLSFTSRSLRVRGTPIAFAGPMADTPGGFEEFVAQDFVGPVPGVALLGLLTSIPHPRHPHGHGADPCQHRALVRMPMAQQARMSLLRRVRCMPGRQRAQLRVQSMPDQVSNSGSRQPGSVRLSSAPR